MTIGILPKGLWGKWSLSLAAAAIVISALVPVFEYILGMEPASTGFRILGSLIGDEAVPVLGIEQSGGCRGPEPLTSQP